MECIALDVLGPLTLTEQGNKYILVVADYFSKWTEAFPMPDQESSTVADFLVKEVISRFGVPLLIHSDQGRNFESALFSEICHMLGMKKTRTTPYHPQSDGMVERFNGTLLDQLAKFADYHQTDWDQHIPFLMMAYRSAVHEATNCSPAKVLFGRDLRLPIDLLLGRPEEECPESVKQYTRDLCQRLERIHCFTREHLKLSSDRMKQRYDLLQEGQPLGVGDAVWLHDPQRRKGLSHKLQRPWKGPYLVIKKINDLIYRIRLGPRIKPKVVHRNRLWKYTGSNPPTWQNINGDSEMAQSAEPSRSVSEETLPSAREQDLEDTANQQQPKRRSDRLRRPPARYVA